MIDNLSLYEILTLDSTGEQVTVWDILTDTEQDITIVLVKLDNGDFLWVKPEELAELPENAAANGRDDDAIIDELVAEHVSRLEREGAEIWLNG